jgi:hypothetical protein
MPLAHVAGVPVEEVLVASPGLLAAGVAGLALLRVRLAALRARR